MCYRIHKKKIMGIENTTSFENCQLACLYKLVYSTVAGNAEIYHIFNGFKGADIQSVFIGDLK